MAFGQSGFGGTGTTGTGTTTPAFRKKMFGDITDDPLFKKSSETATNMMSGNIPEFDMQANIARDAFKAAQAQQAKAQREQIMGAGLRDTGVYRSEGIKGAADQELLGRQNLERDLATQRATLLKERQAAGMAGATSLLQMPFQAGESALQRESTEKIASSDLSFREKQLATNAGQFKDELSFKQWATQGGWTQDEIQRSWQASQNEKGIASTEKIAFADLSFREKQLSQEGSHFKDKLAFDTYALEKGFTEDEKERVWQSLENEKNRASAEKISYADLSFREKELAQNAGQFKDKLAFDTWATNAGFTDAEKQRSWQSAENDKQLTQSASQFKDKLEFDTWATQQGISQQEKDRAWSMNQFDQEFAAKNSQFQQSFSQRERELNIDVNQFNREQDFKEWATQRGFTEQEKDRVWQTNLEAMKAANQKVLQDAQFANDRIMQDKTLSAQEKLAAMENSLEVWKTKQADILTRDGWDKEDARQAADIQARITMQTTQLKQDLDIFETENATTIKQLQQENSQFLATYQQKKAELAQQNTQFEKSLASGDKKEANRLAFDMQKSKDDLAYSYWQTNMDVTLRKAGYSYEMISQNLQGMAPEQAASVLKDFAAQVGVTIPPVPAKSYMVVGAELSKDLKLDQYGNILTGDKMIDGKTDQKIPLATGQTVNFTSNFWTYEGKVVPSGQYIVADNALDPNGKLIGRVLKDVNDPTKTYKIGLPGSNAGAGAGAYIGGAGTNAAPAPAAAPTIPKSSRDYGVPGR